MSEEWTSQTVDDILSDMQRMTQEREQAQARAQEHPDSLGWTMEDVDALLGLDDPLAGFSDYSPDLPAAEPAARPAASEPPAPAVQTVEAPPVKEAPTADLQATKRVPPLRPEAEAAEIEPDDLQATRRVPPLPADAAATETAPEDLQATRRVPPLPADEIPPAGEQATREVPDLSATQPDAAPAEEQTRPAGAGRFLRGKKNRSQQTPPAAEMMEGQMMLQGFKAEDEPAAEVDEKEAARELSERRSEQIRQFRLYELASKYEPDLPPKEDIFEPEPEPAAETTTADEEAKEYRRFSERKPFGRFLQEIRRSAFLTFCGLLLLEIALIIVSAIAGSKAADNRAVLYALNLVLTAGATALSISTLSAGAMDLMHRKPSCDSAALVTVAATLIHSVVALLIPTAEGIPGVFGAAAVLVLLFSKFAKLFESIAVIGNFKFCAFTAAEHLHEIRPFADKRDAFEIARNLDAEDPKLRYSAKTKFPTDFLHNSDFHSQVDRLCKFILPAAFFAALIAAIAGWLRDVQAPLSALTAFTGAVCLAMPAGAALTVSVPVAILMQRLNRRGGMIASPAAADVNTDLQAVAMDATDLYAGNECSIDCYQEFYSIRFDEMFLYAASLAVASHGPLENAFMEIITNPEVLLPVHSLVFEERLGISAQIRGQAVMLGNRNLLLSHSIEAPAKSVEIPYLQEGKRVLYLAVGNRVTTMFVVNYIENDVLAKPMQILHSNETGLIVYAADCNLTEEFLCEGFDLPKGSIRTMGARAGEILRERCAEESENAPALLLHNGSAESLLYTLADAAVIRNIQRIASFVCIAGCVIGWLVAFILMLIKGVGVVNWMFAFIYTLLWTAVSTALGIVQVHKAK